MLCTKCKKEKDLTNFYRRKPPYKYPSDEYHSWCKQCTAEKSARMYSATRTKRLARMKELRILNQERYNQHKRDYYLKVRTEVIKKYGGVCKCCGESRLAFLALDHINGDGNKHRKEIKSTALTYWARKNGYPPLFQVMCHNCNMGRYYNGGICPHQT